MSSKIQKLSIPRRLTVAEVTALASNLNAVCTPTAELHIDASGLEEADLSAIQLMISAKRTATERGCGFHLHAPAAGALAQLMKRYGMAAE
jgi:ABC-type transporter Mla MlaB component